MPFVKKRLFFNNGFAMLSAIMLVVLVAGIAVEALKLSRINSAKTEKIYLREQTELHTLSAIQLTLLEIANKGFGSDCVNDFSTILDGLYVVDVKVHYIFSEDYTDCNMFTSTVSGEQNGTVILDISVKVEDESILPERISYFTRRIEKL